MIHSSYQKLNSELENFYNENIKERCDFLREQVINNSNLLDQKFLVNEINFKLKGLNEKILFGILHWYFPAEIRVIFNLWLEEHFGEDYSEVKEIILLSKETALGYLLVQDRWSSRDFYGNVLTKKQTSNFQKSNLILRLTSKPKDKVFRRGYNDHGSMKPSHLTTMYNYKKFRSLTEQMLITREKEEKFLLLLSEVRLRLSLENCS